MSILPGYRIISRMVAGHWTLWPSFSALISSPVLFVLNYLTCRLSVNPTIFHYPPVPLPLTHLWNRIVQSLALSRGKSIGRRAFASYVALRGGKSLDSLFLDTLLPPFFSP